MSEKQYLMAIDYGGSNLKCCIFDINGNEISKVVIKSRDDNEAEDRFEMDGAKVLEDLFHVVRETIYSCNIDSNKIKGVSFTCLRGLVIFRDANGGFLYPIMKCIDTRGKTVLPLIRKKMKQGGISEEDLYDITGMRLSGAYALARLFWIRENEPQVYEKAVRIHTMMGLLTKAFGADDYYDDSDDVPWLQLNNKRNEYDPRLCEIFDVDMNKLAPLKNSGDIVGYVTKEVAKKTGLKEGTPLIIGTGDQQSGGIGAGCTSSRIGYAGLGTGGNIASKSKDIIRDPSRKCLILGAPDCSVVVEGQTEISGRAFRWLMDVLYDKDKVFGAISDENLYEAMTSLAQRSKLGARGCLFLPYLEGANTPVYNSNAKGAFVGLTLSHSREDIIRSVMEGIAFQANDMLLAVEKSGVEKFSTIRVTGGVSNSEVWNQIQADIYDKVVETVSVAEVPTLGAAIIAAVGLGIYGSYQEATEKMVKVKKRYFPNKKNVEKYKELFSAWKSAYAALEKETFNKLADFE